MAFSKKGTLFKGDIIQGNMVNIFLPIDKSISFFWAAPGVTKIDVRSMVNIHKSHMKKALTFEPRTSDSARAIKRVIGLISVISAIRTVCTAEGLGLVLEVS